MQKRKLQMIFIIMLLTLILPGCGEKQRRITDGSEVYVKQDKDSADTKEEEETQEEGKLFAITGIDTERNIMTLRDCDTMREKPYNYTGATYIRGKYGDNLTVSQISAGDLVNIKVRGETLTNVQISDEVFSYEDLHNFTLDTEERTLTVGGSSYYFDDSILVYHDNSTISLSEISEQDTICMKGIDKQIYTIQVTSGHGTVVLENTEVFQGGYITIGNLMSMKITPQMRIEVAEGSYLLAVANDGYGGSLEITVEANRETKVNLNELKGEGPKFCQIQFKVVPENGNIYLDGEKVDTSQVVEVRYGAHRLTGKADGYADWSRILVVNSKMAEITIELSTDAESEETISTSNNTSGTTSNTDSKSTTGTNSTTNSNNNNSSNNSNNNNNSNNSNNSNNNNSNNSNNSNNNNNSNNSNNNNNNNNNSNSNNSNNNSNNSSSNNGNNNNNNSNSNNSNSNNSNNSNNNNNNSNSNNNNSNSNNSNNSNSNNSNSNNNDNSSNNNTKDNSSNNNSNNSSKDSDKNTDAGNDKNTGAGSN